MLEFFQLACSQLVLLSNIVNNPLKIRYCILGLVHDNQPKIYDFPLNSIPKFIYVSDLRSAGFILIYLGIVLMYYLLILDVFWYINCLI